MRLSYCSSPRPSRARASAAQPARSRSCAASSTGFLRPGHLNDRQAATVAALEPIAHARGQTMAQFALSWVLRHGGMTSALIGATISSR